MNIYIYLSIFIYIYIFTFTKYISIYTYLYTYCSASIDACHSYPFDRFMADFWTSTASTQCPHCRRTACAYQHVMRFAVDGCEI